MMPLDVPRFGTTRGRGDEAIVLATLHLGKQAPGLYCQKQSLVARPLYGWQYYATADHAFMTAP
jgi:hypothetical protein